MRFVRPLLFAACLAGAAMVPARADLRYTFDTDAQGFAINGDTGLLSHEAGGYLRVQDWSGDTNVALVFPQASFAGGWLSYLGGTLSFDARLESAISDYWPEFGTITLFSSLGNLAVDVAADLEPSTLWKTYSVKLDAASWFTSDASFSGVLANLQGVELSLEAGNGPIEVLHIDNVRLATVPEAEAWLMSLAGLLAVVMIRKRRTR